MREVFREADYYRIGGDEFVIICQGIDREAFDTKVAALRYQFSINTICKAAIGSEWSSQFTDIQQLISGADAMMYKDKKIFTGKIPPLTATGITAMKRCSCLILRCSGKKS